MSLWWVQRDQLDETQRDLIENLPLGEDGLILGSPGSGKTNVLLRRAQFVRSQGFSNVLLLTFTRPLAEFIKTGCVDQGGREIFPEALVTTLESWQRSLFRDHEQELPRDGGNLTTQKRKLAEWAQSFAFEGKFPRYDTIFVDEAQDLLDEEVALIHAWSKHAVFVGDSRQQIYEGSKGLDAIRKVYGALYERTLPFHYRVAPEICHVADRIMVPDGGGSLESTSHYMGPRPATVSVNGPLSRESQLGLLVTKLRQQVRVYSDLINQGDRIGVVTGRQDDREVILAALERDPILQGKSKIIRSRRLNESGYDPAFDPEQPICILTVKGCKGLEFRSVHWLFVDELARYHTPEEFYMVVTRAKTSLEMYFSTTLPPILAKAHSVIGDPNW